MAFNGIGLTEVNDSLATIIAAEALGYLKANTVLAQIVNRNYDSEVASHGQSVVIPFRGNLTVNDKAENTEVTLQNPADSKVTVTLNKHKEISFIIEDISAALARPDYLAGYLADGMRRMAEQIDSDIAALYSGFSQTIDATAGLQATTFTEARRQLNAARAPQSDRWFVLHEDAEAEALNLEKITNRDYRGDESMEAVRMGFLGTYAGFNLVMSQNMPVATGQCKNLALHRDAIVFVTRNLSQAPAGMGVVQQVMDEDGVGLRVTLSYSPDRLGVQATIDCLYGVAELRDPFAVVVSTDEV
jgi:hypothetical protein